MLWLRLRRAAALPLLRHVGAECTSKRRPIESFSTLFDACDLQQSKALERLVAAFRLYASC